MLNSKSKALAAPRRDAPLVNAALASFVEGAGWSSPSPQAYSALDAVGVGAAASQLRRTASSGRPVTPTLDGWGEPPVRSPRSSVTAMSSDASASPPPSLHAECAALLDASLSDGGEMSGSVSLESLREQLRRMQLRLAESERCATSLSSEVGNINEQFATTLAHLQNEHVQELQSLESSLRAEAQDALDAAASELEAAAMERAHLWSLLRDSGKESALPPGAAQQGRRASTGHVTSTARVAAWATP